MAKKDHATLNHLVQILDGSKDISEIDQVLHTVTLIHVNNYKIDTTQEEWMAWVTFLKEKGRVSNVGCTRTEIKQNVDGTYTLVGEWTGEYKGKSVVSDPISATYRLHDGKIVELWTTPKNYIFFFSLIRYPGGFWFVFLYLYLLRRFSKTKPALNYS